MPPVLIAIARSTNFLCLFPFESKHEWHQRRRGQNYSKACNNTCRGNNRFFTGDSVSKCYQLGRQSSTDSTSISDVTPNCRDENFAVCVCESFGKYHFQLNSSFPFCFFGWLGLCIICVRFPSFSLRVCGKLTHNHYSGAWRDAHRKKVVHKEEESISELVLSLNVIIKSLLFSHASTWQFFFSSFCYLDECIRIKCIFHGKVVLQNKKLGRNADGSSRYFWVTERCASGRRQCGCLADDTEVMNFARNKEP